eukprot:scaffold53665_cov59-Attheya_sp.AAC.9
MDRSPPTSNYRGLKCNTFFRPRGLAASFPVFRGSSLCGEISPVFRGSDAVGALRFSLRALALSCIDVPGYTVGPSAYILVPVG